MNKYIKFLNPLLFVGGTLLMLYAFFSLGTYPFEIELRGLSYFMLFAIVMNLIVILFINTTHYRSNTTLWFTATLLAILVWSVASFFQASSMTVDTYYFWLTIEDFSGVFVPLFLIMFIEFYIYNKLPSVDILAVLFWGSMTLIYLDTYTMLFDFGREGIYTTSLGFTETLNEGFIILLVWFAFWLLFAMYRLWKFIQDTDNTYKKRQAIMILIGISLPIIGGIVVDGILPFFGFPFIDFAMIFTSLMGLIILIAVYRYGLFSVDPVAVINQLFDSTPEGLIVVNEDFLIEDLNKVMQEEFKLETPIIYNSDIRELLEGVPWDTEFLKNPLQEGYMEFDEVTLKSDVSKDKKIFRLIITKIFKENHLTGYIFILTNITELVKVNKNLENRLEEIEKLNDAMLGRELKMAALKNEIKQLKKDETTQ